MGKRPFSAPKPRSLPTPTGTQDLASTLATWQSQINPTLKNAAPQATPVNFKVTNSRGGLTLAWSPVTGSDGYEILKSANGSFTDDLQVIAVPGANASSYFDSTGGNALTAHYRIRTTSGTPQNPQSQRGPESGTIGHTSIDSLDTATIPVTKFDNYTTDATRSKARFGNYGGASRTSSLGKTGGTFSGSGVAGGSGTSGGTTSKGSTSFASIGDGTNTTASMVVGSGAQLIPDTANPGIIAATNLETIPITTNLPNDKDGLQYVAANGDLEYLPTPRTLAKVSNQWLDSYSATTGLHTQSPVTWDQISNAAAALTLANGANPTTFNHTAAVLWTWANTTLATALASQSSPILTLSGQYWNGSASAADLWTIQDVVANGTNGTSTLIFAHSGSSGAVVQVPLLNIGGTDTGISRLAAGSLALGNGTPGNTTGTLSVAIIQAENDGNNNVFNPQYTFQGQTGTGLCLRAGTSAMDLCINGVGYVDIQSTSLEVGSGVRIGWASTVDAHLSGPDTSFSRLGAASLALGNGTSGDYSGSLTLATVTEQSANGAQWILGQASELLTLSTTGITTDTVGLLLPANAIIESVVARVTTTITTATNWELGDATTAGRFSAPNSTLTAGTTQVGLVHVDQTGAAGPRQTAAAKVRVTTTGIPGAGALRITVFYRQFVAPTS